VTAFISIPAPASSATLSLNSEDMYEDSNHSWHGVGSVNSQLTILQAAIRYG
jgi:hypothetical protein